MRNALRKCQLMLKILSRCSTEHLAFVTTNHPEIIMVLKKRRVYSNMLLCAHRRMQKEVLQKKKKLLININKNCRKLKCDCE